MPDIEPASRAFQKLGFVLTPFVVHMGGDTSTPAPTGTGNRCVMMQEGYLEALVSTEGVETELARQHRTAVNRYVGIHLIAFAVADAATARVRLETEGFEPLEPVHLRRPLATPHGGVELSFTVVRVPPHKMAEGRIQILQHGTPEATWRPDLLAHENPFFGLGAVLICVEDVVEAADRYGRFLGRAWEGDRNRATIFLDRGRLVFVTPDECGALLPGVAPPAGPPVIPAITLTTPDLERARHFCSERGIKLAASVERWLCIDSAETMGAAIIVHQADERWPPPRS